MFTMLLAQHLQAVPDTRVSIILNPSQTVTVTVSKTSPSAMVSLETSSDLTTTNWSVLRVQYADRLGNNVTFTNIPAMNGRAYFRASWIYIF